VLVGTSPRDSLLGESAKGNDDELHGCEPVRGVLKAIGISLACLGALVVVVSITPVTGWWVLALSGSWTDVDGDVLIVLGGDGPNINTIGATSYWRAVYAIDAARSRRFKKIVVSGQGQIATSIRDLMLCQGVTSSRIVLETAATSTRENALFTRALLTPMDGKKVLLTSDYHIYRAKHAFARAGIEVSPNPIPDAFKNATDWKQRWSVFVILAVETGKIAWYRWQGWL
jgi:uncharacterized SAM-binding protein YcdF (DUF218 family)